IACLAGLLLSFSGETFLVCMAVFFLIFFTTHYVSLGSLLGALTFLVFTVIKGQSGSYGMAAPYLLEMYILIACIVALAFFLHRANIGRLLKGEERKTYLKSKK
nr:glycerol-3-phosphate acyltransferase [Lachnospiraceae bacterium]